MEPISYRKNEPAPSPNHILMQITEEDGSTRKAWILAEDLRPGPIRHENLDPLVPVLRWQWRHLGPYLSWCRSFEDWELGFMRDTNPGKEINLFTRATYAFLEFTHRHPEVSGDDLFVAIINMVNGKADHVEPKAVRRELQKLLRKLPRSFTKTENFTDDGQFTAGAEYFR